MELLILHLVSRQQSNNVGSYLWLYMLQRLYPLKQISGHTLDLTAVSSQKAIEEKGVHHLRGVFTAAQVEQRLRGGVTYVLQWGSSDTKCQSAQTSCSVW